MTRIIRIELCDECPHAAGSQSCRASQWCDEGGILRCRKFTDYPLIPEWCPLEQVAPDWKPPATIDLNGPPRYARSTTDAGDHAPCLRYADRGGEPHAAD